MPRLSSVPAAGQQDGGFRPPTTERRLIPQPQVIPWSHAKGLDESQEPTALPEGFLVTCRNWMPEPTGILRARLSWRGGPDTAADQTNWAGTSKWSASGGHTAQKLGGLGYAPYSKAQYMVALNNSLFANRPEVWVTQANFLEGWTFIDRLDDSDFGGSSLEDGPNWFNNHLVAFAKGVGSVLYCHPQMTVGIHMWDGKLGPDAADRHPTIIDHSPPAQAIAFHLSRFFAGGTREVVAPDWVVERLYYSRINGHDQWAGSGDTPSENNNYIDIQKGDGHWIVDLVSFQGQLMVGKTNGLWILTGADPDTFNVTKIDGVRCSNGRSLVVTPAGLMILGDTEAWFWKGGDPQLVSTSIQESYAAGENGWRTGAYAGGKVFITSQAYHDMHVFDVTTGAWSTEDMHANDDDNPAMVLANGSRLVAGTSNSKDLPALIYRDHPFGDRLGDVGGMATPYLARTPDLYITHDRQPVTLRHVWVRVRQRSGNSNSPALKITPYVDGQPGKVVSISPSDTPGVITKRVDQGLTGLSIGFGYQCDSNDPWDIEEVNVEVDILGPR